MDEVKCSDLLLEHARELFPPGGSVAGSPSFELFCEGPLRAAIELFSRQFDEAPEAAAGVKVWVTIAPPWFHLSSSTPREWAITSSFST